MPPRLYSIFTNINICSALYALQPLHTVTGNHCQGCATDIHPYSGQINSEISKDFRLQGSLNKPMLG